MSLLKYIQRLERMHLLIRRGATGNTIDFAKKVGLSRRQLMEDLNDLKQLGAPIKYENVKRSYVYKFEWHPLGKGYTEEIKGGRNPVNYDVIIGIENFVTSVFL